LKLIKKQTNRDHPVQIVLYHYGSGKGKNEKMRKLYFSTDTELKSFCERTIAQLLSPATIYFRIGHSALFRK